MVQNGAKAVGGIRYLPVGSKPTARMGVLGEDGEPDIKPLGQKAAALQKNAERKAKLEAEAKQKLEKSNKDQVSSLKKILPVKKDNVIDYAGKLRKEIRSQPRKIDSPELGWLELSTSIAYADQTGRLDPETKFALYKVKGTKAATLMVEMKSQGIELTEDVARYLNQRFGR